MWKTIFYIKLYYWQISCLSIRNSTAKSTTPLSQPSEPTTNAPSPTKNQSIYLDHFHTSDPHSMSLPLRCPDPLRNMALPNPFCKLVLFWPSWDYMILRHLCWRWNSSLSCLQRKDPSQGSAIHHDGRKEGEKILLLTCSFRSSISPCSCWLHCICCRNLWGRNRTHFLCRWA